MMLKKRLNLMVLVALLFSAVAGFPAASYAESSDVPLAVYHFEDNANDSSGNDNHGIIHGGVTFSDDGYSGKAAVFDGTSGYVEMPQNLIKDHTNFSITAMFKTTKYGSIVGYQNEDILDTQMQEWIPILYIDTDGKMRARFWTGSSSVSLTSGVVNDGNWHKVKLFAGANIIRLFIDNQLIGEKEAPVAHLQMSYNQIGVANASGYATSSDTQYYFEGMLDEFSIESKTYAIAPLSDRSGEPLKAGYTPGTQEQTSILLVNTGTGTLENLAVSLSGANADAFEITQPASSSLAREATAPFTIKAKDGLGLGTYVATVTVKSDQTANMTFTYTQEVQGNPPAAPQNLEATAREGEVSLKWDAVTDATYYNIYAETTSGQYGDTSVATVTYATYTLGGLANGTTYYFVVKAGNDIGLSASSDEARATPTAVVYPVFPSNPAADILINGVVEKAGTVTTATVNGRSVTTITWDQKKLEDKLDKAGPGAVVTIPVNGKTDVIASVLSGRIIKSMESKQAIIEFKTEGATYTLPSSLIDIDALAEQMGSTVSPQDIEVRIEIANATEEEETLVKQAALNGAFEIAVPPVSFTVSGKYGDKIVSVSRFDAYVERTIAIPEGVDPDRITTGIVLEPDGTVRHVPTKVIALDGKYYAQINSLTNSAYALVWNPVEFGDVRNHWAKDAVRNMGSRMVIDGVANDLFAPDREMTRAEFAAVMVRALGLPQESGASAFTDVAAQLWFHDAVYAASANGLLNGFEDGSFRPSDSITREQAMVVIARAMKLTGLQGAGSNQAAELQLFADAADVSDWAVSGAADSVYAGIVSGRSSGELAPQAFVTRAEVAQMTQLLLRKSALID